MLIYCTPNTWNHFERQWFAKQVQKVSVSQKNARLLRQWVGNFEYPLPAVNSGSCNVALNKDGPSGAEGKGGFQSRKAWLNIEEQTVISSCAFLRALWMFLGCAGSLNVDWHQRKVCRKKVNANSQFYWKVRSILTSYGVVYPPNCNSSTHFPHPLSIVRLTDEHLT